MLNKNLSDVLCTELEAEIPRSDSTVCSFWLSLDSLFK